jgi:DNA adenine methylase
MTKEKRRVRPPFSWYGGKQRMVAKLLPLIPKHHTYVEPFGGSAALLLAKPPSPVEVYNDADTGLVNFFRILRDPKTFRRFKKLADLMLCSRLEYNEFRRSWREQKDPVRRAFQWYIVASQSFSGHFANSWGYSKEKNQSTRLRRKITLLDSVVNRLQYVQIDCGEPIHIIQRFDGPTTFFYLDPPYVPAICLKVAYPGFPFLEDDHRRLVKVLLDIQGKVILSCFDHPIYTPLRKAWRRRRFVRICSAAGRTRLAGLQGPGAMKHQKRTETIYYNFDPRKDPMCSSA